MKEKNNYTGLLFLVIFLAILLACMFCPEKVFSENENRALKSRIDTSAENVFSGDFDNDAETYLTDQFPGRDMLVTVTSDAKRFMGLKEINGVYLGSDGYLITKTTDEDISVSRAGRNAAALSDFFYRCGIDPVNITVMPVPDAGTVLSGKLPRGAAMFDADKWMSFLSGCFSGYNFIDMRSSLSALDRSGEQTFYRTDHHWTTAAAQSAYNVFKNSAGSPDRSGPSGNVSTLIQLSDSFHGSLYSKVMCSDVPYDTVEGLSSDDIGTVNVSIMGRSGVSETRDTCYDVAYLDKKDKYSVFFGGNYGEVRIETMSGSSRRALVIKDSFANSFVPFMTGDFSEIDMIDLRYFTGDVDELIRDRGITDIIVLYELSNILNDENITKLASS